MNVEDECGPPPSYEKIVTGNVHLNHGNTFFFYNDTTFILFPKTTKKFNLPISVQTSRPAKVIIVMDEAMARHPHLSYEITICHTNDTYCSTTLINPTLDTLTFPKRTLLFKAVVVVTDAVEHALMI
jgi:hypothetical protein